MLAMLKLLIASCSAAWQHCPFAPATVCRCRCRDRGNHSSPAVPRVCGEGWSVLCRSQVRVWVEHAAVIELASRSKTYMLGFPSKRGHFFRLSMFATRPRRPCRNCRIEEEKACQQSICLPPSDFAFPEFQCFFKRTRAPAVCVALESQ